MPLYKTHIKFNIFLLFLILPAMYFIFHIKTTFIIIFTLSFIYSTLFMNPDVDICDKIKLFSIKGFFTIPFRLYAKVFKHRKTSHHIIFGTISRIGFLLILFFLIIFLLDLTPLLKIPFLNFLKTYKTYILYSILGIFVADFLHIILDKKIT